MFKNYIKIAFRNLFKHKGYSLINIAGLAIGLTCTILILMWVQDELGYDKFHENANRIFRVVAERTGHDEYGTSTPAPLAILLKNDFTEIDNVARFMFRTGLIARYRKNVFNDWRGVAVDPSVFKIFSFPLIKGYPQTALNDINSIVLTEETALKCFGDEDPIGRMMEVEGDLVKVTGILKNIPSNSEIQFDFLRPFQSLKELTLFRHFIWNWFTFHTYVQLKEHSDAEAVNQKIADLLNTNRPWSKSPLRSFLQPLTRIHLHHLQGGGPIKYVIIFSLVAFFILLIACINFMNLSTARSAQRTKEVSMRKVVGSNRIQIVYQFFSESILITSISVLIAMILVEILLPWFNHLSGKQLTVHYWDVKLVFGLLVITLVTGILSGSYPALVLSSFQPVNVLKGNPFLFFVHNKTRRTSGTLFRKMLIIIQFILSIGLIICTTVIYKQLQYMRNGDPGFNKDNLVRITIPENLEDRYEILKNEFSKSVYIINVTGSSHNNHGGEIEWEGMPADQERRSYLGNNVTYMMVDMDYITTFDMKIVEGRNFSSDYPSDIEKAYLINEEAVRQWELELPVGKRFTLNGHQGIIIGVYKNFHWGLKNNVRSEVLYLTSKTDWDTFNFFIVKLKANHIQEALVYIKKIWEKYSPDIPLEFHFVDDMIDKQYHFEKHLSALFTTFSFLAIFISCLGLLGLTSFMSEQRTKEIGVRKVLGASVFSIIQLLVKDFSKWIILANVISWPIAYYVMQKWLQDYPYRIYIEIWIFLLSGALALVIALLTVSYQAIKAATANPVEALRYE